MFRILEEVGLELKEEQRAEAWKVLKAVAEGRLTLLKSPADVLRSYPEASEEMMEGLWGVMNEAVIRDRSVALLILDYFAEIRKALES
jgi:hypothetical protein